MPLKNTTMVLFKDRQNELCEDIKILVCLAYTMGII